MNGSRYPAFVAYLLGPLGWLYVGIAQRKNRFAVYHTVQAIGLLLFVGAMFAGWYVLAWLLSWIPVAGPTLGVMLFALVILALLVAVVLWIVGMYYALHGRMAPLPLVGRSIGRLLSD
jgi:uncharacterized membrane protein